MTIIELILYCVGAVILSILIGFGGAKLLTWAEDRKIKKNAIKVINGEKENKTEIEGKIVEVNKFITYDEHGNKILIELQGGTITKLKNGKKENKRNNKGRISSKISRPLREDSRLIRKKKRDLRNRRFG